MVYRKQRSRGLGRSESSVTVKGPKAARNLVLHLLLLKELKSHSLLLLPHLLEHEHLGLLLSGLLS